MTLALRVRISYFSRRALQAPTKIGELDCLGQSTSRDDTYGPQLFVSGPNAASWGPRRKKLSKQGLPRPGTKATVGPQILLLSKNVYSTHQLALDGLSICTKEKFRFPQPLSARAKC